MADRIGCFLLIVYYTGFILTNTGWVFILLTIIVTLTPCNRFKYLVRKSIHLRTFILDKKSINFNVRISLESNYKRLF